MMGVTLLHHHPSKRMMVLRFRVAWRGGMVDGGGNFAAPSPSKRMMALLFRVAWRGGMADDGGNFAAPSPSKRMIVLRFRVVLRGGRASQRLLMTAVSDAS